MKDATWMVTVVLGVLCLFFAVSGTNFPKGAGLFPMLVGGLGVVAALICLYGQIGKVSPKGEKIHFSKSTLWAVGITFAYPLLVFLLGYVAGSLSFILALVRPQKGNSRVLLSLAALVFGLWLVFTKFLLLRLPSGVLWEHFS